jgi:putative oligomerization/nucleic acid binding protein
MLRPRKVGGRWVLVAGGAAAAAKRRGAEAKRQQQGSARAPEHSDVVDQIRELSELREQGILTEEEFTAEKKKLLGI